MGNKTIILVLILSVIAMVICLIVWTLALIGSINITDGCLYRYSYGEDGTLSPSDSITKTVTLKANGNYTPINTSTVSETLTLSLDPSAYGEWLNSGFFVHSGKKVKVKIRGDVSLCKSYLPRYNLQSVNNTDPSGNVIEIPRVEDRGAEPISLIMDATLGEWRNTVELFQNDHVVVAISPDMKTTSPLSTHKDDLNQNVVSADCSDGKREYSPICGRYTRWDSSFSDYVSTCHWDSTCYECNCRDECDSFDIFGVCITGWYEVCDWCGCYKPTMGIAPEPYQSDGLYTSPYQTNVTDYDYNFQPDCRYNSSYVFGDYQDEKFFWLSADDSAGLLYRYDSSVVPTNATSLGSGYTQAAIGDNKDYFLDGTSLKVVHDEIYPDSNIRYLQYRLYDSGTYTDNTGGYVLNVKHTKCRRSNGEAINDTMSGRGAVEYVILPVGDDANSPSGPMTISSFVPDGDGVAEITIPGGINGNIWLKIRNRNADYIDSFGQYEVSFFGEMEKGSFLRDILNPLFEMLKETIDEASQTVFKNMTCYQGVGDAGDCLNFFNYIRALLILYIMVYAFMFLLGMTEISQMDLVVRVVKIAIVAGLLNEGTYDFFSNFVFGFVTSFNDEIIANMSGYSMFTTGASGITNPFIFLEDVMTKIFLSNTFATQVMAILSLGMNGIYYFIIIVVTLVIVIIAACRGLAVYLMAYVAIAVLIGLAPIFLTFILFERTRYLFENWVRFTFRYMLEPLVMLAGLIILMQLFTIYLDIVIGYSVCWRCALTFKIPFPNIPGLIPALANQPIFCFNFFAPWGLDRGVGPMSMNFSHIAGLLIIGYCMYGYINFSGKLVARIAGSQGGPSATRMGKSVSDKAEKKVLKAVGLDKQSRAQMKAGARKQLKSSLQNKGKSKGLPTGSQRMDRSVQGKTKAETVEVEAKSSDKITSDGPTIGMHRKAKGPTIGTHRGAQGAPSTKSGPTIGAHRGAQGAPSTKSGPTIGTHRGAQGAPSTKSGPTIGTHRGAQGTPSTKSGPTIGTHRGGQPSSSSGTGGKGWTKADPKSKTKSTPWSKGGTQKGTDEGDKS